MNSGIANSEITETGFCNSVILEFGNSGRPEPSVPSSTMYRCIRTPCYCSYIWIYGVLISYILEIEIVIQCNFFRAFEIGGFLGKPQ